MTARTGPEDRRQSSPEPSVGRLRVSIVEDDRMLRESLAALVGSTPTRSGRTVPWAIAPRPQRRGLLEGKILT